MKSIIVFLIVFFSKAGFAQEIEKIVLTKDGFIPSSIVIENDTLTSKLIYERTLVWIKKTYAYPDKVITTTIENSMIRIEGSQDATYTKSLDGTKYNVILTYTLEINIKDGKYKLDFYKIETTYNAHKFIFNKKGTTRNEDGKRIKNELESSLNSLITSINNAITGKTKEW